MYTEALLKVISETFKDCPECGPINSGSICAHKESRLIEFLNSENPKIRNFGFSTLIGYNKFCKSQLILILQDDNSKVVLRGLETIVKYDLEGFFDDDTVVNLLNDLLKRGEDLIVVWTLNAFYEVAAFANKDSYWLATEILERHDNYLCRETAAAFLGVMANYGFTESLLCLVSHCLNDKIQVKKRALLALAEFDSNSYVETDGFSGTLREFFVLISQSRDLQLKQLAEDLKEEVM